jgi:hypothetical protein
MNNFELSQLVGEKLNLEKVKAIRVSFGDEVTGVYFGEYGENFDNYIQDLKDEYGYFGDHKIQHVECHPDFSSDIRSTDIIMRSMLNLGYELSIQGSSFHNLFLFSCSNEYCSWCFTDKDLAVAVLNTIADVLDVIEHDYSPPLIKYCKNCKHSRPNNVKTPGLDSDFVCPTLGKSLWLWFAPEVPNLDKHGNPFYCSSFTAKDKNNDS